MDIEEFMNSMEKKRTYRAARIRRPREEQIYLTAFPEVRLRAIEPPIEPTTVNEMNLESLAQVG